MVSTSLLIENEWLGLGTSFVMSGSMSEIYFVLIRCFQTADEQDMRAVLFEKQSLYVFGDVHGGCFA